MARKIEEAAFLIVYDCQIPACSDVHVAFGDLNSDLFSAATLTPEQVRILIAHLQNALYAKAVEKDGCPKPN